MRINFLFLSGLLSVLGAKAALPDANYLKDRRGCILLYNVKTAKFEKEIGEACRERYPACSTFKVPLAVMAFDSGVIPDENHFLKWDGKKDKFREEPNRDHNAKTWMRDSVLWFSQRITPKLGAQKFQKYLDDFSYGNRDFAEGLTTAWVTRPGAKQKGLEITAYEQADFMKKLWNKALPVSPRSMKLTREITFLEVSPRGFRLSGKTGSNFYDKDRKLSFGWFIAHLQKDNQEYIVVTNLSDVKPSDDKGYGGPKAKELTKRFLADQGLW